MYKYKLNLPVVTLAWLVPGVLVVAPNTYAQLLEPNLNAKPAFDLALQNRLDATVLVFSTTTWNSGRGPLELVGTNEIDANSKQRVNQRIYDSNGSYTESSAGFVDYHPEHQHIHFNDYALYELQPVRAPGASSRTGAKTTFCILDTTRVNRRLPGSPKKAVYKTCGTKQGMSVGWGDTYGSHLAGQEVDFTGNPNGDYKLMITVDPLNKLTETNETDNESQVCFNVTNSVITSISCP
jgi:hypothetical protein